MCYLVLSCQELGSKIIKKKGKVSIILKGITVFCGVIPFSLVDRYKYSKEPVYIFTRKSVPNKGKEETRSRAVNELTFLQQIGSILPVCFWLN